MITTLFVFSVELSF